jgi:LysM repeat protein
VRIPRRELARFLAPAALLLALTIAALLVRAGLRGGDDTKATTPITRLVTERVTTAKARTTTTKKKPPAKRFYTIRSGDTLDVVAAKFQTTTERLLALNPGIDPHALTVGQKVRVG